MGYVCLNCKEDVELDSQFATVRCPYCGYRVLLKKRPSNPRTVEAD